MARHLNYKMTRISLLMISALALSACNDLFAGLEQQPTASGGQQTGQLAPRPKPDSRGVITYPNYPVIVARRNDTMQDIAARVGMRGEDLARHNGLPVTHKARQGEVFALPKGVISPTGSIEGIATAAIDRSAPTPAQSGQVQKGPEPIRHIVEPGETAYSIARLYGVSVTALASWNGLDRNLSVRPNQQLLIPVTQDGRVKTANTGTPEPPSASKPLPDDIEATPLPESPNLITDRTSTSTSGKLLRPVNGKVLRGYSSKNEGLDIAAPAGTAVKAAETGSVALISKSVGQHTIVLLRHPDNLYTVYSNITDVSVKKGQNITRGQTIGKVAPGDPSFVHFEIRRGTESVDPAPYL